MGSLSMIAVAGFTQSDSALKAKLNNAETVENAARADASLINNKTLTSDSKKKKSRRGKTHKECSRMKS